MSLFVTGTDTNIGKTLISAALLHAYALQGKRVVGMKPVAAGCEADGSYSDVMALQAASNVRVENALMNPYRYPIAVAPHLAAQQQGDSIELPRILQAYVTLAAQADVVVVEGAGGFILPLNAQQDGGDLAVALALPVVLVVGMRLGCLNHALLTAQAIRMRGLKLAGWVANCVDEQMTLRDENIATLQQRIGAPLLGVVPYQAQPDARYVAASLDMASLASYS
jgi:dethiobiotin synthetase